MFYFRAPNSAAVSCSTQLKTGQLIIVDWPGKFFSGMPILLFQQPPKQRYFGKMQNTRVLTSPLQFATLSILLSMFCVPYRLFRTLNKNMNLNGAIAPTILFKCTWLSAFLRKISVVHCWNICGFMMSRSKNSKIRETALGSC